MLSIRITEVFADRGWYYITCIEFWKKVRLEDGVYKCPRLPTVIPLLRYRFTVRATDTGSTDPHTVKFADFYLFGPRREVVVGKEALVLVSNVRAG